MKLEWKGPDDDGGYEATVPARDHRGLGEYRIYAIPRPHYCDRGRWHVLVFATGVDGLDGQEGFPRYYFKLENLKEEMELWVEGREEVRAANKCTTSKSK